MSAGLQCVDNTRTHHSFVRGRVCSGYGETLCARVNEEVEGVDYSSSWVHVLSRDSIHVVHMPEDAL